MLIGSMKREFYFNEGIEKIAQITMDVKVMNHHNKQQY